MSQELHYTSVSRGLRPGTRGFCTVALTPHMTGPLVDRLEGLSAYQPVYPPDDSSASLNPIVYSHLKLSVGGKGVSVLSRIGPAGLDYSGRPNKYAHHVALDGSERPEGGPAWLLSQPGFMQAAWSGEPRELASGRTPPRGNQDPGVARSWQALTGDGGWAGVLAESFLADPKRPVFLVFQPGLELLPLFVEAVALMPVSRRWEIEFSTYFSQLPQGITCAWRGVLEGSEEAKTARRLPNSLFLDLSRPLGLAEGRSFVHVARTGEREKEPRPALASSADSARPPTLSWTDAMNPDPRVSVQASVQQRRSCAEDHDLVPELARLVARGRDDSKYRNRRKVRIIVGVVTAAVGILSIVAVGLVRTWSPTADRIEGIPPISNLDDGFYDDQTKQSGDARNEDVSNALASVSPQKRSSDSQGADKIPPNTGKNPAPNALPLTSAKPSSHADENVRTHANKEQQATVQNADGVSKPLFLGLEEPISLAGGRSDQKQLRLNGPDFRVAKMNLLGGGEDLRDELKTAKGDVLELMISRTTKGNSQVQGDSASGGLARFEVSPDKHITFRWGPDHPAGDKRGAERNRLRDCVLAITSNDEKTRYCILRDEPGEPRRQSLTRPKREKSRSVTQTAFNFDTNGRFAGTMRTLKLKRCRFTKGGREEAARLEKKEDGSWTCSFEGNELLSVRLDKTIVLIDFFESEPSGLAGRSQRNEDELKKRVESLSTIHDKTRQEEIKNRIADLRTIKRKLQALIDLYHASIDATVTYEVAGLEFEIAKLHVEAFPQSTSN